MNTYTVLFECKAKRWTVYSCRIFAYRIASSFMPRLTSLVSDTELMLACCRVLVMVAGPGFPLLGNSLSHELRQTNLELK